MENRKGKRTLRILIGVSISVASLVLGVVSGVKIGRYIGLLQQKPGNNNNNSTIVYENAFDEIEDILRTKWYSEIYYGKQVDEELLINQFVGALSSSDPSMLDPYTYLIKNERVSVPNQGKLGITISNYFGYPIIVDITKGGAADTAGLKIGDVVLSLTNTETNKKNSIKDVNINFNNVFTSSLGLPGDTCKIEYARINTETNKLEVSSKDVILGEGIATPYTYLVNENVNDTIMVKLTGFTSDYQNHEGTYDQFKEILENDNSKNLIIDLRDNGGGDLSSVIDICDLFLPKDKLVCKLQYKDNTVRNYKTDDKDVHSYEKIVILQNGNTASASEILISTLLYYAEEMNTEVTLVGTKSYGKGIAQQHVYVMEGAYTLSYTCAKWLRPDDSWIGMTIDNNSTIGFYPDTKNYINTSETLRLMDSLRAELIYKENVESYDAFTIDNVANENIYFFTILNDLYDLNVRDDGYFDESCKEAIKNYQSLKGLDATGSMNELTFITFAYEYYLTDLAYDNSYLNKAEAIIGA